jgi:phosphatidylglycerophosphate synthase
MRGKAANALTASRILLTPAFAWCVWRAAEGDGGRMAALLYAFIAASDYYDGPLARRLGTSSRGGRMFDHAADVTFLLSALLVYHALEIVPWWVPASIGASFSFYAVDSWRRQRLEGRAVELRGSRVGHAGGVMNYVLVGVLVFDRTAGLRVVPGWLYQVLFGAVPLYSAAAIAERLKGGRSGGAGLGAGP